MPSYSTEELTEKTYSLLEDVFQKKIERCKLVIHDKTSPKKTAREFIENLLNPPRWGYFSYRKEKKEIGLYPERFEKPEDFVETLAHEIVHQETLNDAKKMIKKETGKISEVLADYIGAVTRDYIFQEKNKDEVYMLNFGACATDKKYIKALEMIACINMDVYQNLGKYMSGPEISYQILKEIAPTLIKAESLNDLEIMENYSRKNSTLNPEKNWDSFNGISEEAKKGLAPFISKCYTPHDLRQYLKKNIISNIAKINSNLTPVKTAFLLATALPVFLKPDFPYMKEYINAWISLSLLLELLGAPLKYSENHDAFPTKTAIKYVRELKGI